MTTSISQVTAHVISHRGNTRPANEDTIGIGDRVLGDGADPTRTQCLTFDLPFLCAVADGMGGHACGALASQTAIRHLLSRSAELGEPASVGPVLEATNDVLYGLMRSHPQCRAMGTTVAGVLIRQQGVTYFNVGDSRIYDLTSSLPRLLSVDDVAGTASPSGRTIKRGITQSLGGTVTRLRISPHVGHLPLRSMRILICSDGLTDMVEEAVIASMLNLPDAELTQGLFEAAMEAGGIDNISIAVLSLDATLRNN